MTVFPQSASLYSCDGALSHPPPPPLSLSCLLSSCLSYAQVAIYDRVFHNGTSGGGYPDFIDDVRGGKGRGVLITTSQKGLPTPSVAVLLELDANLIAGLATQRNASHLPDARTRPVLLAVNTTDAKTSVRCPALPATGTSAAAAARQGFAFTLWLDEHDLSTVGQTIMDGLADGAGLGAAGSGGGLRVTVGAHGAVQTYFGDATGANMTFSTGPACSAMLLQAGRHFVAFSADAGPSLLSVMVDGVLCDGGGATIRGFAWIPAIGLVPATAAMRVAPDYGGALVEGKVYGSALYTSELVAAYRHGLNDLGTRSRAVPPT